jgi:hypothetical protein
MKRAFSIKKVAPLAATSLGATFQRREIYSIWGTTSQDSAVIGNKPLASRLFADQGLRSFAFNNTPSVAKPGSGLSEPEEYLISALQDDYQRVLGVDWTVEFDPFWKDRLVSHERMFDTLYGHGQGLRRMLLGNYSHNTEAKQKAEATLNRLRSAIKWAEECERAYSQIFQARFIMQREVFDAFQREKILAGCVEVVENFKAAVPEEFKRKATSDLGCHLGNMRHWVWDCPNAKQEFPRQLA